VRLIFVFNHDRKSFWRSLHSRCRCDTFQSNVTVHVFAWEQKRQRNIILIHFLNFHRNYCFSFSCTWLYMGKTRMSWSGPSELDVLHKRIFKK
jgi:hypothetical protein